MGRLSTLLVMTLPPAAAGTWLAFNGAAPVPIALAVYAVGLGLVAALFLREPSEVRMIARAAANRERGLASGRGELQARIDFLSAEREIGIVLNEDVDFRTILDRVLGITCDTLGGSAELWMLDGGKLVPRARRVGEKTEFNIKDRADRSVLQCFEAGRLVFEAEEGRLHALAPLQSDREIMGVVRITVPLEGDGRMRQEQARVLSRNLEEFSKFLALALKTPDLYTRAVQDGLTGLWTKRHFMSQSTLAFETARRYGEALSLVMIDIDHFKKVNDTHGHQAGDRVLKGVAAILSRKVRGGSTYRYGGEEMSVLLPKLNGEEAAQVAERLRKGVASRKFGKVKVTASFGIAELDDSMEGVAELVEKADGALYKAKESGRNKVVVAKWTPKDASTRRWHRSA